MQVERFRRIKKKSGITAIFIPGCYDKSIVGLLPMGVIKLVIDYMESLA
jgi:hypothetical protein